MVRGLSQEAVNKITWLTDQAWFTVCSKLIHYLDPNVPEALVSMRDCMERNHCFVPVTNGATHFPPGAWILT